MMFRLEPLDIVIIVVVLILVFGANRIPEVARGIGKAMREFRNAVTGKDSENDEPKPKPAEPSK